MIRPLWQLQDREKAPLQEADLSVLFGPKSKIEKKKSDAHMSSSACAPLCPSLHPPPPCVHTLCFTDAGNIQYNGRENAVSITCNSSPR